MDEETLEEMPVSVYACVGVCIRVHACMHVCIDVFTHSAHIGLL